VLAPSSARSNEPTDVSSSSASSSTADAFADRAMPVRHLADARPLGSAASLEKIRAEIAEYETTGSKPRR